jgi:hypothetical protein
MVWNRAHAMNIGIRYAQGEYFLSTDIDLIYSENVLENLSVKCSANVQVFSKAFLLPRGYSQFDKLDGKRDFKKTDNRTFGLFHCTHLDHMRAIHGYDQYYRIWGFEDKDIKERIGLPVRWLEEDTFPIYHQWHRPGSVHEMMTWLWQDMTIHYALSRLQSKPHENWGELILSHERPLNNEREIRSFECSLKGNRFTRRKLMIEVVSNLLNHPELEVKLHLQKPSVSLDKMNGPQHLLKSIPQILRIFAALLKYKQGSRYTTETEAFAAYWHFIYSLIFNAAIVRDYRITRGSRNFVISLLGRHTDAS